MDARPRFSIRGSPSGVDRLVIYKPVDDHQHSGLRLVRDLLPVLESLESAFNRKTKLP